MPRIQPVQFHIEYFLPRRPTAVKVSQQLHADRTLVEHAAHNHFIAGLAMGSQREKWLEAIAPPLHDLMVKTPPKE